MDIITFKGKEISGELVKYNAVQLKQAVINYDNPIIKAVQNTQGIKYLEKLQGKTKAGAWLNWNKDELGNYGGIVAGVITTAATGGAAAPFLPLFGIAGNLAGQGGVTDEKKVMAQLTYDIEQAKIKLAAQPQADNKKYIVYTGVFIFSIILIYLIFKK